MAVFLLIVITDAFAMEGRKKIAQSAWICFIL